MQEEHRTLLDAYQQEQPCLIDVPRQIFSASLDVQLRPAGKNRTGHEPIDSVDENKIY